MIPHHRKPPEDNVDSWLMSYADMITLLLCFFIIFVSVSEPKKERLTAITEGLATKFGGAIDLSTPFHGAMRAMQTVIETHEMLKDVSVEQTDASVEMELSTLTFYQKNSAEFNPDKKPLLIDLVSALKKVNSVDYRIVIEGHTSDVPVETPLYPSNWELSSARAARMARFLIEQGIEPFRLRVEGYADTKPAVPNTDMNGLPIPENRDKNQRIVIKLERPQ